MTRTYRVSVVGASGYTGGELVRLLLRHPSFELGEVTSDKFAGKTLASTHPNLRKVTDAKYVRHSDVADSDVIVSCAPHGKSASNARKLMARCDRYFDLSADFRLKDAKVYERYYGPHADPELLEGTVYGIPELHRKEIPAAKIVSGAGCIATSAIIPLWPLFARGLVDTSRVIIDSKVGSSAGGAEASRATHHPERAGIVRAYAPAGHRHQAEVVQELTVAGRPPTVHLSAHAVELVRGILTTSHLFLRQEMTEKDIWKVYREAYGDEPFVRIVKERDGIHRLPEPKMLAGTNLIDIGFEREDGTDRLVVISALDNLTKGSAGAAVQNMNIALGLPERTGLDFVGMHPV